MCKSEIFAEILSLVEEETEVSQERILSKDRDAETVDARSMLAVLLFENGFSPASIAGLIRKSHRCVNCLLASYKDRAKCKKLMRIQMDNIRKAMGSN